MAKNEFIPDYKVAPFAHIQELASYFISEKLKDKEIDPEILLDLISGNKKIEDEEAILLEKVFGYSKELWLALQKDYDDDKKRGKKDTKFDDNIKKIFNNQSKVIFQKIKKSSKQVSKSKETKKKISNSLKGNIPWNKGKKMSKEFCEKVSKSQKGRIPWNKGLKRKEDEK